METLILPGSLDSLSAIAQYVKEISAMANLDQKTTYKLRLAVDEIATNIFIHGYEEAGIKGEISISGKIEDQKLMIIIQDTGEYFDPQDKVDVEIENLDKPIEEKPIGNLGIYLAVDGVDQFYYDRKGNTNYNTFVINLKERYD